MIFGMLIHDMNYALINYRYLKKIDYKVNC